MIHEYTESDPGILSNGTVVVDFYADWCGPCKKYAPVFEELAQEYFSMTFVKVNTDDHEALVQKYTIMSLPTTLVLINGKTSDRVEGYSRDDIKLMIEKFKM
jgi:thioredoxin 1